MKNPHLLLLALLFIVLGSEIHSSAAQLQIDGNGQLTGALGVELFGTLYDVSFKDGTCAAVFNGCDELSDFTFVGDSNYLDEPSVALRDQVFLNVAAGSFDTDPSLIQGCSTGTSDHCFIQTPTEFFDNGFIGGSGYLNSIEPANMYGLGVFSSGPIFDSSYFNVTWARWSLSGTPVPIPAAFVLFGSALSLLIGGKIRNARNY